MAGEIEEPFSFSFQAESLHSGSVSFGRFKNELSWERRSAFSHNRYVEEVEKCLKPGSVVERKAYFEAHFKKRGLPRPTLAECYSGPVFQACENDASGSDDAYGEESDQENEGSRYADSDDQMSEGSVYLGEFDVTECKKEEVHVVPFSSPQRASASLNHTSILVDGVVQDVNFEETHEPAEGCDKVFSVDDEPARDLTKNLNGDAANGDEPFKTVNTCPKIEPAKCVDKTIVERGRSTSSKLKAAKESKSFKPKASFSPKGLTDPRTKSNTRQREGTRRTENDKLSSKTGLPTRRTPKLEDSRAMKGKSLLESRRDKVSSSKKLGEPLPKPESRGLQMTNRPTLTKSSTISSVTTFKFKSSERAERRKEFYMKLEEKMQAKEDEMNMVQARKQEITEAEMKQIRKGLNFKAAPMPSFYQVAKTSGPDQAKTVSSRSTKVQRCHGNALSLRLTTYSKSRNSEAITESAHDATAENNMMAKSGVSESDKVGKSRKTEEKQKVGAQRNSREVARKTIKGVVGFGSSSKMSHLVVGVAS